MDRLEKAYCNLQDYGTAVPSEFQYFPTSSYGGASRVMDYCPYFNGYSNTDCRDLGMSPTTPDSRLSKCRAQIPSSDIYDRRRAS